MKLFDSHCHLDDKIYKKDFNNVVSRANITGVLKMMIVGVDKKSSAKAVALAELHPDLYASVGFHPHDAKECSKEAVEFLIKLAKNPKVKAWGEIGLDFNRMYSPREDQERWLVRQLEISDELNLPVIFHERESNGRLIEILAQHFKPDRKGVIHCFSGNEAELNQYLSLGLYIGITGILTIKSRGAKLRQLVPLIPSNRILIETDAPYLTPAPEKNKFRRNEPAFVKSVLLKLAEVRGEKPDHLAKIVYENTCRLYNI
ncbi:MAG: TatD family hydrolase [Deltaproteobacteria bacterium]|nr:TatD family hydrolase [Deltaproteobacteria bacterium]NNK85312.1 TatD family hydrolase [Desulfobacterales bacterium]